MEQITKKRGTLVRAVSPTELDEDFYLELYPDVVEAGMSARDHYFHHGSKESRIPSPLGCLLPDDIGIDPRLPTLLITSNDLSRTGAPVLGLQLMKTLASRYNIIVLTFHSGDLEAHFLEYAELIVVLDRYVDRPLFVKSLMRGLLGLYHPQMAILNTVLSWIFAESLTEASVPTVHLVHEYVAYSGIGPEVLKALAAVNTVVFSSHLVMDGYKALGGEGYGSNFVVIPQGKCEIPTAHDEAEADQALEEILWLKTRGKRIVLGAGNVQIRKGVDLFLMVADRYLRMNAKKNDVVFVWIGKGFDPLRDLGYSAYLEDQRKHMMNPDLIRFLPDSHRLQDIYGLADGFLLTSRLDPLPNVGIDAILEGVPIYCFDGATGLVEILTKEKHFHTLIVPYLDTDKMAQRLFKNIRNRRLGVQLKHRLQEFGKREFSFTHYSQQILSLISFDNTRERE